MLLFFKNPKALFYAILLGLSIFPFLYHSTIDEIKDTNSVYKTELFRPELNKLNSIDKVVTYVDSIYFQKSQKNIDTVLYVNILSRTIKERFRYGQSNYTMSENWIARLLGSILWEHMSAIVNPEDILKRKEGLCSQQTIVFMETLKRKRINVRTVGLGYKEGPGHFLCEVMYAGQWHLHDVTLEPKWDKITNHHKSVDYYLSNKDSLYTVYQHCWSKKALHVLTSKIVFGKPNEFPAKKMMFFHKVTLLLTYIIPVLLLFLLIFELFKKKNVATSDSNFKKSIISKK